MIVLKLKENKHTKHQRAGNLKKAKKTNTGNLNPKEHNHRISPCSHSSEIAKENKKVNQKLFCTSDFMGLHCFVEFDLCHLLHVLIS